MVVRLEAPSTNSYKFSLFSTIITILKSTTGLADRYNSSLLVHEKSVYPLWLIQEEEGEEKGAMYDKARASSGGA